MKLFTFLIVILTTLGAFEKPNTNYTAAKPVRMKKNGAANYSASNTAFGIDLYQHLETANDNLVFSPYSITACLSMVYLGAREITAVQMHDTLRFTIPQKEIPQAFDRLNESLTEHSASEKDYQLFVANGVWVDSSTKVLPAYNEVLQKDFGAKIEKADFKTNPAGEVKKINAWIAEQTKDKIQDLLTTNDITSSTRLLLANAVYFKGSWMSPFRSKDTSIQNFHPESGGTIPVHMMKQTGSFLYYESSLFQLLSMPFTKDRDNPNTILCGFILPKSFQQLSDINAHLTEETLTRWLEVSSRENVQVSLPKFTINFKTELNNPLMQLGMINPFTFRADFSGINGLLDLYLSKVVHQAYLDLNENGVEATAATAAVINMKATAYDPHLLKVFKADRPFIFFLYDQENKTVLFLGKLSKPKPASEEKEQ